MKAMTFLPLLAATANLVMRRYRNDKFAVDSPLEGTGFEPSVPPTT